MRLWELVISEDRRNDLSDAATAREWVQRQPWWLLGETVGPWDAATARDWAGAIRSLRSIVRRLGFTRNTREPDIEPVIADRIAGGYVGLLQPYLHRLRPTEGAGLTRATFGGLRLRPVEEKFASVAGDLRFFFQRVFGSLFVPDVTPPVCSTCGRDLPTTAGGRPSRRKTCGACRQRASFARKSQKAKREIWNKQYQTKRKSERATNPQSNWRK
jgi:hypothetical protein